MKYDERRLEISTHFYWPDFRWRVVYRYRRLVLDGGDLEIALGLPDDWAPGDAIPRERHAAGVQAVRRALEAGR